MKLKLFNHNRTKNAKEMIFCQRKYLIIRSSAFKYLYTYQHYTSKSKYSFKQIKQRRCYQNTLRLTTPILCLFPCLSRNRKIHIYVHTDNLLPLLWMSVLSVYFVNLCHCVCVHAFVCMWLNNVNSKVSTHQKSNCKVTDIPSTPP